jgi:protein-disulfide isomerase
MARPVITSLYQQAERYSMRISGLETPINFSHWFLTLAILFIFSTASHAEPTAAGTAPAAINQSQADAILEELKEIRKLLEKIEKKGLAQQAKKRQRPTTATVTLEKDRPVLGAADAPVTVVEFTDYQCPYCRRFTQTTFPLLKRDYIDTGKVRWVVRDLPLAFHKNARKAGQSVHCANEQGKFWEMRDMLFKNSKLQDSDLRNYAEQVDLDLTAFDSCLASDHYMNEMDKDSAEAKRVGITGTPSFVLGKPQGDKLSGKLVVGAQPLNVFKAAIEEKQGGS